MEAQMKRPSTKETMELFTKRFSKVLTVEPLVSPDIAARIDVSVLPDPDNPAPAAPPTISPPLESIYTLYLFIIMTYFKFVTWSCLTITFNKYVVDLSI